MTEEEAFRVLEYVLGNAQLNKVQEIVFRQTWAGRSYMQISKDTDYDYGYIKDTGYELWRCLSVALDEKVTKHNVQHVLKQNSHLVDGGSVQQCTQPKPSSQQFVNLALASQAPSSLEDQEIRWTGRAPLIESLTQKMHQNCRILNLVGITGIGKSSLSIRLSLGLSVEQTWGQVKFIQCDREANTFEQIARQLLGEQVTQNEEFRKNPQHLIEGMIGQLQSSPVLLIIDMIEELLVTKNAATDPKGVQKSYQYTNPLFNTFFEKFLTHSEMPSRLILTSQILPPVLTEGRYDTWTHSERLNGLTDIEAIELFELWDIQPNSDADVESLRKIIHAYEGHPLALKVIAGEIREIPYQGNIQAYWYEYGNEIERVEKTKEAIEIETHASALTLSSYSLQMTDLVEQRVERSLQRLRQANPLAYNLLCMGAVYRSSVERAGWICMIDDAPLQNQLSAWQTLQRRFLLEESILNNKVQYRLHSLIRSVALQHLEQL